MRFKTMKKLILRVRRFGAREACRRYHNYDSSMRRSRGFGVLGRFSWVLATLLTCTAAHAASTVEFKSSLYEANELDGRALITLTCTPPPTNTIRVILQTLGGDAREGDGLLM